MARAGASPAAHWPLIAAATAILLLTTGARQSLGLYLGPLVQSTGLAVAEVSLALAVGQFVWGATQPVFGAVADRYGAVRVVIAGALLMALGFILTPGAHSTAALIGTLGLLSAAGAGAGSFSILIAATSQRLAPATRGLAAGILNAGASAGQFVFAPLNQLLIVAWGWRSAISAMAVIMLATIPLSLWLRGGRAEAATGAAELAPPAAALRLRDQLAKAARNPSYALLHAGFFTCGFHVAFLVTHLPGEVRLCGLSAGVAANSLAIIGLANIAGSLAVGVLGNHIRLKFLLCALYATRAAAIAIYLALPHTTLTFYAFAAVLGLTWLSTVPPTAGLVGKLFGTRHLATLFGLTLLTHQIGAFFGAWLGGLAVTRFGDYSWMWYADILLALGAALVNLPIQEARPGPVASIPAARNS